MRKKKDLGYKAYRLWYDTSFASSDPKEIAKRLKGAPDSFINRLAQETNDTDIIPSPRKVQVALAKKEAKRRQLKKEIKEGFETHVLCSECWSGDLELSKLKTKIRCTKCGNVGLTESILGLEEGKSITENKAKLGSGARFKSLTKKLEKKGAENPKGLAAYIGRKKFGKKKFQKLAVSGKK